jgi:transcriptional regulator with XRE-family HTH domain
VTIGERIRTLRKETGLTLEKFGECIGVKKAALSLIENDRNGPSDQTIRSIAREFAVSEEWLRTGEGPMRTIQPDQIVAEVREKLHLSEWGTTALERFLRLPSDDQRELLRILEDLFGPFEGDDKIEEAARAAGEAAAAAKRAELLDEKRDQDA